MRRARGGPLGNGGMGEVYLVEDTLLERQIGLKFLASDLPLDSGYRFPAQLQRPNRGPALGLRAQMARTSTRARPDIIQAPRQK